MMTKLSQFSLRSDTEADSKHPCGKIRFGPSFTAWAVVPAMAGDVVIKGLSFTLGIHLDPRASLFRTSDPPEFRRPVPLAEAQLPVGARSSCCTGWDLDRAAARARWGAGHCAGPDPDSEKLLSCQARFYSGAVCSSTLGLPFPAAPAAQSRVCTCFLAAGSSCREDDARKTAAATDQVEKAHAADLAAHIRLTGFYVSGSGHPRQPRPRMGLGLQPLPDHRSIVDSRQARLALKLP